MPSSMVSASSKEKASRAASSPPSST
jgi:hypothetical protein